MNFRVCNFIKVYINNASIIFVLLYNVVFSFLSGSRLTLPGVVNPDRAKILKKIEIKIQKKNIGRPGLATPAEPIHGKKYLVRLGEP